jgi:hypothetical protein
MGIKPKKPHRKMVLRLEVGKFFADPKYNTLKEKTDF